jgi:hypothetical protein
VVGGPRAPPGCSQCAWSIPGWCARAALANGAGILLVGSGHMPLSALTAPLAGPHGCGVMARPAQRRPARAQRHLVTARLSACFGGCCTVVGMAGEPDVAWLLWHICHSTGLNPGAAAWRSVKRAQSVHAYLVVRGPPALPFPSTAPQWCPPTWAALVWVLPHTEMHRAAKWLDPKQWHMATAVQLFVQTPNRCIVPAHRWTMFDQAFHPCSCCWQTPHSHMKGHICIYYLIMPARPPHADAEGERGAKKAGRPKAEG